MNMQYIFDSTPHSTTMDDYSNLSNGGDGNAQRWISRYREWLMSLLQGSAVVSGCLV